MVGRDAEAAELRQAWTRLAGRSRPGGARTAVITGAGGLGKSLLVDAAVEGFAPRPATVLVGRARVHSPAPYDWLAGVLSGRSTDDLPVPRHALAWLAQQPDAPPVRYAPDALLRLAVRTVRALVGAGPAVLVVEDLHALDPASLNLVAELAGAPELPALLLVTSRPAEDELVARTLARLSGAPGAIRQHLQPLREAEVAGILAQVHPDPLPAETVAAVRERTGGNPYRLLEMLATAGGTLPEDLAVDAPLTAREMEVLSCLAAGMSNKQVARHLGISIRTVAVHVSNLLRKTRSASRTEAALWAVRHRVAEPVS